VDAFEKLVLRLAHAYRFAFFPRSVFPGLY